ncbi:MAG: hypothetical protein OHK0023_01380 [Anaerolineae bacterium]
MRRWFFVIAVTLILTPALPSVEAADASLPPDQTDSDAAPNTATAVPDEAITSATRVRAAWMAVVLRLSTPNWTKLGTYHGSSPTATYFTLPKIATRIEFAAPITDIYIAVPRIRRASLHTRAPPML